MQTLFGFQIGIHKCHFGRMGGSILGLSFSFASDLFVYMANAKAEKRQKGKIHFSRTVSFFFFCFFSLLQKTRNDDCIGVFCVNFKQGH